MLILRMNGAVLLLWLYAFVAWAGTTYLFIFMPIFSDAEVEKRFSYFVKYSNSLRPGIAGWFSWQLVFSSQQWAKILLFTVTSTLGVWSTEPTSPVAAG
jgi:hypothetical protein